MAQDTDRQQQSTDAPQTQNSTETKTGQSYEVIDLQKEGKSLQEFLTEKLKDGTISTRSRFGIHKKSDIVMPARLQESMRRVNEIIEGKKGSR